MLLTWQIAERHLFFRFTESSWNDDQDTGRSIGCFFMTYMGGVVDHSSNMPDPVALSSAKVEYNKGCIAFMKANHLQRLLCKLDSISDETMEPTSIYFARKSAIAMSISYKDTKHTQLIMWRYHYVRGRIAANRFVDKWNSNEIQIVDIGTKLNDRPKHKSLI